MGWGGVAGEDRKRLRRVVMLLLALAGLCERASLRSAPVRAAVLWLLRPGEEIARAYVAALTGNDDDVSAPAAWPAGDGAADALGLATRFHALAATLSALLAALEEWFGPGPTWPARSARASASSAAPAAARWMPAGAERRDSS